jgi:ferredoxin-nitrate reductase
LEVRVDQNLGIEGEPDKWVHSACGLCSNGCGLEIAVKDGRIVGVRGDQKNPVNFGHLGPKGENVWRANYHPSRGTRPLIRNEQGKLVGASWEEAMNLFIRKFRDSWNKGRQHIACYNSGQLLAEEYYVLGKILRAAVQTPNLDANTRLCTATPEFSLEANFGADGPPASYVDVDHAKLFVHFGHNVAEQQTVLWERILEAKKKNGARIIVVDPRRTPTVTQGADLHLQIRGGTNVALMNGLIHLLIKNNWFDSDFVSKHTVGFETLDQSTSSYTPERVSEICGIPKDKLERAAEWIGTTDRVLSTVLQGFYQSVDATGASSLVNSMHLIMGKIGKPGAGPLQMAGQPSAMSNREVGATGSYPGYRNERNTKHMKELCKLWNLEYETFHPEIPVDIVSIFEKIEVGEVDFLWVIGTNPAVSMPNQNKSKKIMEKPFVVVQDPFADAETVEFADIYFPAAMWGEKTGCMTNADRSVNLLLRAVDPPGEARSDFDIFMEVSRRLDLKDKSGKPLCNFAEPKDAWNEWRKVSKGRPCDMSGLSYELILEMGSVRWPVNKEHPRGTDRLYEDFKFWTGIDDCEAYGRDFKTGRSISRQEYMVLNPKGKAFLKPCEWQPQANPPSEKYPFLLNTGRVVYHWHTRTKTGKVSFLNDRVPHAYCEINPEDAERFGIKLGDLVSVSSELGKWEGRAMVVETVRPGSLFIPFHYGYPGESANQNTTYAKDPVSKQPQFKQSRAMLQKVADGQAEEWLIERRRELTGESSQPFASRDIGGTKPQPSVGGNPPLITER